MNSTIGVRTACCFTILVMMAGCEKKFDPVAGEASPTQVIANGNAGLIRVAHPEQFPTVQAGRVDMPDTLNATGSVYPDVSREVPVISIANGRVVDIKARLGDNVKKGQLLFTVESPDINNAFDVYLKSEADEKLAHKAYLRAKDLYDNGAISQAALEQAEDTETDAKTDLMAAEEQLKIFGVDKSHPNPLVNVYAPTSGVIIGQNITNAAAAGVALSGTATAFTVADLSTVWIVCDVFENDLPSVHLGQEARIKLAAYPDRGLSGTVSDIGPVLDPSIRTAKVRIEVANPGVLRLGMFVTVTLMSRSASTHATVPASAILHLHDRDWVFVPGPDNSFRRVEVEGGEMRAGKLQEILAGITPGQQVVKDVLQLEATLEAQ